MAEEQETNFREDLAGVINRYSRENGSDTPDFILGNYLAACLAAWDAGVVAREKWYGRPVGKINLVTGAPRDQADGGPVSEG